MSTYISYSLAFFAIWIFKLTVPSYLILLTMLAVLLACFVGDYLGYYMRSKTFDRLQRSVMRRIFYARKRVVDSLKHSENSFAVAKKLLNTKLHYFPQSFPLEEGN